MTKEEIIAYNKAIDKCVRLVSSYDGLIPDEIDRMVIVNKIKNLKYYKKPKEK